MCFRARRFAVLLHAVFMPRNWLSDERQTDEKVQGGDAWYDDLIRNADLSECIPSLPLVCFLRAKCEQDRAFFVWHDDLAGYTRSFLPF